MKSKRLIFIVFVLVSLSCKFVTNIFPEPVPTVTYVPPMCQGKPISTIPPETTLAKPTPGLDANPLLSKDQQLRVLNQLVNVVTDNYLYPNFNGLDWSYTTDTYRTKVETGIDTEEFYIEMAKLIYELGDEHSFFETPVQVAASDAERGGKNEYVGIGVSFVPLFEKNLASIVVVFPGSSAEQNGLKQHDSILAVDGLPVIEGEIVHVQRLRGPECSAAVLTVKSPEQAPRKITIIRHQVTTPLRIDPRLVPTDNGSRIGYIYLPTFYDETIPVQVKEALEEFGTLDGLILDNRMNGGGSLTVLESLLAHFTSGTLGHFISRSDAIALDIEANPIHNSQTVPLVVLVSQETGSFGEVFSGVLQDTGRAKLVGQTTMGNVEALTGYYLEDGSIVWIAQERFDPAQSHANWEEVGVEPDLEVHADWDTFTFENDPGIAAALRLFDQ